MRNILHPKDIGGHKLRRAQRFAWLFGLLPWVRLVCACGSVAWGTADEESDIDFCIVTKPGRIWSTRFIIAGTLEVFGLRPAAGKKRD
ncbi:MAG: nucleotidyltransferase domain-containing protein, partial [bacterium]|nr:nucleotidyltransferase domain-containing protein [bacterium]